MITRLRKITLLTVLLTLAITLTIVNAATFYERKIVIVNNAPTDLYDYQVNIILNWTNFNFEHIDPGLTSLRFYDEQGNELPYWIEYTWKVAQIWRAPAYTTIDRAVAPCMIDENGVIYAWLNGDGMRIVRIYPNGTMNVIYEFDTPTYLWSCFYEPSKKRIIFHGTHHDGTTHRAGVVIYDMKTGSVTAISIPNTALHNWFMSGIYYNGYYFFGEWENATRAAEWTTGTIYTTSGGVWKVPEDRLTDPTAYTRIWQEPDGLGIWQFAILNGKLYAFAKNATLVRIYVYDPNTDSFSLVRQFTDVRASTTPMPVGVFSFSCDAFWQPNYTKLFLACQNTTTNTIHILTFNGTTWTDWDTGIFVDLNSYGPRITVLPDEKTIILQIMARTPTWEDKGIRTVYVLYLDSKIVEPITMTFGTGGAFKTTYVLNKSCVAIGEYHYNDRQRVFVLCREASIWVKVPHIPASGIVTIYMRYSPTPSTPVSDPSVMEYYEDFSNSTHTLRAVTGTWTIEKINTINSIYVSADYGTAPGNLLITNYNCTHCVIMTKVNFHTPSADIVFRYVNNDNLYIYAMEILPTVVREAFEYRLGGSWYVGNAITSAKLFDNDTYYIRVYVNGSTFRAEREPYHIFLTDTKSKLTSGFVGLHVSSGASRFARFFGYIAVAKWIDPPPIVALYAEQLVVEIKGVQLPNGTVILRHNVTYSPSATAFTYTFTATNTTTAGYTTSSWSIKVYANPYLSGGVAYENTAMLTAEVTILLPYDNTYVDYLELSVRTNGTGTSRQLWIKVLDSLGSTLAELTNVTMTQAFTTVKIPINATVGTSIRIWINMTVISMTTAGEEIEVRDIKVHTTHVEYPTVRCDIRTNLPKFICTSIMSINLGSTNMVNNSYILLYIISPLEYNGSDYSATATYIGDEVIDSKTYSVYRIDNALSEGTYSFYTLLENVYGAGKWRVHVHDVNVTSVLVGEIFCVELPLVGNITIMTDTYNLTYINVTSVCVRANETGDMLIIVARNVTSLYSIGYSSLLLNVKYGNLTHSIYDLNGSLIDYGTLKIVLHNKDYGVTYEGNTSNGVVYLDGLIAGNYTILVYYADVPICNVTYWLNITTTGRTIVLNCSLFRLSNDYRNSTRVIAWNSTVSTVINDLGGRYRLSRIRLLVNGNTGEPFCILINYSTPPTNVNVTANISVTWSMSNGVLKICGSLGSVADINVTDLYKLRIVYMDMLSRLLAMTIETILNNTIKVTGYDVTVELAPGDYVIVVPLNVSGFLLVNTTQIVIQVLQDTELELYYRIPTMFSDINVRVVKTEGNISSIYVYGYLLDYYGVAVPNRPVYIYVYYGDTIVAIDYVNTDNAGYFVSNIIDVPAGATVKVITSFNGDDIYVMSTGEKTITVTAGGEEKEEEKILPIFILQPWLFITVLAAFIAAVAVTVMILKRRRILTRTLSGYV